MTAETDLIQQLRAKVIAFQEGTHLRPKPSAAARAEMRGIQGTLAVVLAEIDAALQQRDERLATVEHERAWQPIETYRPTERVILLVALIQDGIVWRVSEASFNGLGWYTKSGEACHWRTHYMPLPPPPKVTTDG